MAAKYIFVTNSEGPGDLSSWEDAGGYTGIAAADAICRAHAARSMNAYILEDSVNFKALLSTSGKDAKSRIFITGEEYYRADNIKIADNLTDLLDGTISVKNIITERGRQAGDYQLLWTGTQADGTKKPGKNNESFCTDWESKEQATGVLGSAILTTGDWLCHDTKKCEEKARLYCIQDISLANLKVQSFNLLSKSTGQEASILEDGQAGELALVIENDGNIESKGFYVEITVTDGTSISKHFSNLAPGTIASVTWEWDPVSVGTHTISLSLDDRGDVNELYEDDNTKELVVTVRAAPSPQPTVTITPSPTTTTTPSPTASPTPTDTTPTPTETPKEEELDMWLVFSGIAVAAAIVIYLLKKKKKKGKKN